MNIKSFLRQLNAIKIFILLALFTASSYLLVLRMMWHYDSSTNWWSYQIFHVILFLGSTYYFLKQFNHRIFAAVLVSILIGFMPYELWFTSFIGLNSTHFSELTKGLPDFLRIAFEFSFYPLLQFLLLIGVYFVVNNASKMKVH